MKNKDSGLNQALLDGIKTMISKGYSFEQIKKYLLEKNYPENTISQHYNYTKQQVQPTAQTQPQNTQALVQIVDYIRNMETRGYTFQQIRNYLLQKGYSAQLIDDAAAHLPQQPQQQPQSNFNQNTTTHRHEVHLPGKTALHIFAIFFALIIVIGGGYYFINIQPQSQTLLDLIATPENTQVIPGEDLRFNLNILSMGSKETFDMYITYDILDENLNVIESSRDTIAIFTSTQQAKRINIPEDFVPGKYTMNIHSDYNGKMAQTRFDFRVKPPIPGGVNQTPGGEQGTGETQDPELYVNLPPLIENPEETQIVRFGDFIDRILRTSRNDPVIATNKCMNIKEEESVNRCISSVSIEFDNPNICAEINNSFIRDDCYIAHLINGKFEVCTEINNTQMRSTCNLIRDLYLIQEYENGNADLDELLNELGIELTVVDYIDDEIEIIYLEE